MAFYTNLILLGFLILMINLETDALQCYQCNGCNDPFSSSGINVITNNTQGLYCRKISTLNIVNRDISSSCSPVNVLGNGQWCCQSDLCNGAEKTVLTNSLLITFVSMCLYKLF